MPREVIHDQRDNQQNHGAQQDGKHCIQISQPTYGITADDRNESRRASRRMHRSREMHEKNRGRHRNGTRQGSLMLLRQEHRSGNASDR